MATPKRELAPRICAHSGCGVEFHPKRVDSRYCSDRCRLIASKGQVGARPRPRQPFADVAPSDHPDVPAASASGAEAIAIVRVSGEWPDAALEPILTEEIRERIREKARGLVGSVAREEGRAGVAAAIAEFRAELSSLLEEALAGLRLERSAPRAAAAPVRIVPSEGGGSRGFALASGGTLTLSLSVDLLGLGRRDRELVAGLLDMLEAYESSREGGSGLVVLGQGEGVGGGRDDAGPVGRTG